MRKYLFLTIIFALLLTTICYAGDVPESLLASDEAKVFFGEVLDYHPNTSTIVVHPVKSIKGDIIIGSKQTFNDCQPIKIVTTAGNVYLMTYYDEDNPLNVFEVTSYDTKTLKIKNIAGLDMWERLQTYLNEGRYEEAEMKRLENTGITAQPVDNALPPLNGGTLANIFVWGMGIVILLIASFALWKFNAGLFKKMRLYLLILTLAFYFLPFCGKHIGNEFLLILVALPLISLVVSAVYGVKNGFNIVLPLFVGIVFLSTLFIFYNYTAWVYVMAYAVISAIGSGLGSLRG